MSAPRPIVPRADRIQINLEFASVEAFINEYVANISHSGVFIRSKDPLPIGTRVALKFTVIMDELETIEGIGEVVRSTTRPSGMGVVFVELTEYSQGLVAKLITQRAVRRTSAARATKRSGGAR
ncbi:MAG: PilZ domain-containing protein [Polyangia bacterium]